MKKGSYRHFCQVVGMAKAVHSVLLYRSVSEAQWLINEMNSWLAEDDSILMLRLRESSGGSVSVEVCTIWSAFGFPKPAPDFR